MRLALVIMIGVVLGCIVAVVTVVLQMFLCALAH